MAHGKPCALRWMLDMLHPLLPSLQSRRNQWIETAKHARTPAEVRHAWAMVDGFNTRIRQLIVR